ncbi:hypothetical protein SAMN05192545_2539 [Maribacter dokdonensis]|uniref:DUF202 domain-containing protein n=1 Tax=Maribacter dokdonensis TaxID=320912 RepID=A0ABY0UPP7_9FLAO|nr:hypothetical protein [Maribacter dokdonensis]SDT00079.1 hypothetical protein SAMN05192545_2539 [Maribacter dokdonensis]
MGKTKKEIEEWKEYRLSVLEQKSRSDDDFEKYITFIASGALGLTITFIDNISPLKESIGIWVIALGWVLLALTLFINLLSHYLSSKYNEKTIQDIDDEIKYEIVLNNIEDRNRIISQLNLLSIIFLGLGIVSILTYTIINAYQ